MTTHEEPNPCIFPTYSATAPCDATACGNRRFGVDACKVQRCPHRWQREAAKDRERSDEYYRNARCEAGEAQKHPTGRGEFEQIEAARQIREGI